MTPLRRWFRVAVLALLLLAAFVPPATAASACCDYATLQAARTCRAAPGELDYYYCYDTSTGCTIEYTCIYY